MGVSGPEPSPQALYIAAYMGAGKRQYPKDTADHRGYMTMPGATAEEAPKNQSWRPEGGGERTYQSRPQQKERKHSKLKEIYSLTATV